MGNHPLLLFLGACTPLHHLPKDFPRLHLRSTKQLVLQLRHDEGRLGKIESREEERVVICGQFQWLRRTSRKPSHNVILGKSDRLTSARVGMLQYCIASVEEQLGGEEVERESGG